MGKAHANPILDTRFYQVESFGGKVTELTTSVIVESTCVKGDAEGYVYSIIGFLIDDQKDDKVMSLSDQNINVQGRTVTYKSAAGWQICLQWSNRSTSWEKLSNLKEFHPLKTYKFMLAQGLDHEPAFNQ